MDEENGENEASSTTRLPQKTTRFTPKRRRFPFQRKPHFAESPTLCIQLPMDTDLLASLHFFNRSIIGT